MAFSVSKSTAEKVVTDKEIASALPIKVGNATGSPCSIGHSNATPGEVEDGTGSSYAKDDDGITSNEAQVINAAAPRKDFISKLAPELLIKIIDYLDRVESTCLGLTCKAFYPVHFDRHRKVALYHYVRVKGLECQSSTYTRGGTMLANFLTTWVPSHLKYNYEKRRFVTEEKFKRFIEDVREEEFANVTADAEILYEGLYENDYEDMVDRYMEEAEAMGFEYENRPMLEPTLDQEERSERWRSRQESDSDSDSDSD